MSDVVKECRAHGLTEPILDRMLDGISNRCETISQRYRYTMPTP
jgi:hypothetical protein